MSLGLHEDMLYPAREKSARLELGH